VTRASAYRPADGMAFAVRLLNSWDELEPDPELLSDEGVAARFLRRHGFGDAAALVDEDEVTALRELRERLREAWVAATDERAVELLNALLGQSTVQPRLARGSAGWEFRWDAPGLRAWMFGPPLCAATLLDEIRVHGRRRLGICAAGPCRCAFVDRSRNRSRRYCCEQCADRANQAAYRRRRRTRSG
jgi:predicted RNA-binding Zn ribbon-like protein